MFRIRIKSAILIFAFVAFSVSIATWISRSLQQRAFVTWVEDHDGIVLYRFQTTKKEFDGEEVRDGKLNVYPDRIPKLLIDLMGYDFFCDVSLVKVNAKDGAYMPERLSLERSGIHQMNKIESLNFINYEVEDLQWISNLKRLRVLKAASSEIKDAILLRNFSRLKVLSLKGIGENSNQLGELKELKHLRIDEGNKFDFLSKCTNLTSFQNGSGFSVAMRKELPTGLKTLDVGFWTGYGHTVQFPSGLECLILRRGFPENCPNPGSLPLLRKLVLRSCKFDDLRQIGELNQLEELTLYHCQIGNLEGLKDCTQLKKVVIDQTDFRKPNPFQHLSGVTELELTSTKRLNFENMKHLKNLKKLLVHSEEKFDLMVFNDLPSIKAITIDREYNDWSVNKRLVKRLLESKPELDLQID